jgi:flagellin
MADITLSKAVRSNLLNLQSTATQLGKTQEKLATGLKVNSALDNPTNFFTASSLNSRAGDLGNLLDSVSNAIQTVEAADNGIAAITKLVETAQSAANQALQDKSNSSVTTETAAASVDSATTQAAAEAKTLVGDIGLTAGDTITLTATDATTNVSQSFTHTVGASDTVEDLVTAVNGAGFVSASVSSAGVLSFSTEGTSSLATSISAAEVDGDADALNHAEDAFTALGFTSIDSETDFTADGAGTDIANLAQAAAGTTASAARAEFASQYDDLLDQIDQLAGDAGFNGVNLLGGSTESLQVTFNETGTSSITLGGVDFTSAGLGLTDTTGDFASDTEINAKISDLKDGLTTLRSQSSKFGSNLSVIETRQNFTKDVINTLETGAANLTLADSNEEAANLLALQTRQQLSSTALSLASQADQNVLRLF